MKNLLRILPLGGVDDVTKNMFVYEYGGDIVIVDCGIGFPKESMPGVDLLIPDPSPLLNKLQKIRGIVLTHGHEDHIGALPYLLPQLNFPPVYGTKLTCGLAEAKLKEFNLLGEVSLRLINPDETFNLGCFRLSFFRLSHSIPDAVGIALNTPVGLVIHTGDFKFDWTPVSGSQTEVGKIAKLGEEGVLALLSDCLRVEKEGYTLSESFIEESFREQMRRAPGRVFITTYSSNISRIQQAINASEKHHRRVVFLGRSMESSTRVAQKLGFLKIPRGILLGFKNLKTAKSRNLTLITAGAQAQPGSALSRIAAGEHDFVKIRRGDTVLFSADPIPGNEEQIDLTINNLTKQGARVFYSRITDDLHVSGHAAREELKLMIGLTKPQFLIPIGGTPVLTRQYSLMAEDLGYDPGAIFELGEGQVLELGKGFARRGRRVGLKNVMVDGLGVGDVGNIVLRDREILSKDGIFVVIVPVDKSSGRVSGEIEIISRGFVYMKEAQDLVERAKRRVRKSLATKKRPISDWYLLRQKIGDDLEKFLWQETKRRPMILPVVIEV